MSGILTASVIDDTQFLIGGKSVTDFALSPADAYAEVEFRTNGGIYNHLGVKIGSWIFPNEKASSLWEIRASNGSPGNPDYGTMNTWLALSVNRSWANEELGIGSDSDSFDIELRYNGGAVVATATYTVNAEVDV